MNRMIFHVPFKLDKNPKSASGLRPNKMIEAFKNIGYEVCVVAGKAKERKEIVKIVKNNIKDGVKYDFCYSESSTMPTLLTEKHHLPTIPFLDFDFFKVLKKNSIPIALFYRDVYWNFDLYKKNVNVTKRVFSKCFYKYDLKMYNKYIDVLLLPSMKMLDYIPYPIEVPEIYSLPPGCEIKNIEKKQSESVNKLHMLYVGGITPPLYDITPLVNSVKDVEGVYLKIICRKNEYEKMEAFYGLEKIENIDVVHESGEQVSNSFREADVFSIVRGSCEYLSFAMPYKFFEALTWELPIITANGTVVANFIKENDIGWVLDNSYGELFKTLSENKDLIDEKVENIKKIKKENTWDSRAEFVVEKLIGLR